MQTYKFRIYPTVEQKQILDTTLETCRKLYNECLEERIKENISRYDQQKRLTQKKKNREDLQLVNAQVLQEVVHRVDNAFIRFFSKQNGYPKFKRYGRCRSITYPQWGGFRIRNNKLLLSKIGYIKIKIHRIPIGSMKICTIFRDIDRWFALIVTNNRPRKSFNRESIGIDLGLTNWLTLSNGEIICHPRFMSKSKENIKQLQRELARKKKGSKNREKARIRLAKAWRKVRLQRQDYCHKISNYLTKNYSLIIFEKLRINSIIKRHSISNSIADSTWGQLKRLAAYKAEVIEVNPHNTTQICSNCERKQEIKIDLKTRIYNCQYCGLVLGRDENAAKNILKLGQELALVERKPLASSFEGVKLLSMKQKEDQV